MQHESTISRPIVLCPPSISANSTTGDAILFGICLTGLQGLRRPLGWEPAHATAGATADVTVAETEPTSVLQLTLLQKPVADLRFLKGRGQVPKARGSRRHRHRGDGKGRGTAPLTMGRAGAVPLPKIF